MGIVGGRSKNGRPRWFFSRRFQSERSRRPALRRAGVRGSRAGFLGSLRGARAAHFSMDGQTPYQLEARAAAQLVRGSDGFALPAAQLRPQDLEPGSYPLRLDHRDIASLEVSGLVTGSRRKVDVAGSANLILAATDLATGEGVEDYAAIRTSMKLGQHKQPELPGGQVSHERSSAEDPVDGGEFSASRRHQAARQRFEEAPIPGGKKLQESASAGLTPKSWSPSAPPGGRGPGRRSPSR